jgi:hypothetical protein
MEGRVLYMEFPAGDIERERQFWSGVREVPARIAAEIPSASLHARFAECKDSEGNIFHLFQR